jgi:general stress protein 26
VIALNEFAELFDKLQADRATCLVGTASAGGAPQISPKGSVAVYDATTLFYWERALRSAFAHVGENPQVVVYYRGDRAKAYPAGVLRFHGRARIVDDPAIREAVWTKTVANEREKDPEKKGAAILIDVERVDELSGKVVMQRA